MNILSFIKSLFGSGDSKGPLTVALERILPDKNARAEAAELLEKTLIENAHSLELGQLEVNKEEAKSSSLFVAGWRPAVGWICGFAMAWQYVLEPMLTWAISVWASYAGVVLAPLPKLDTSQMMTVLLGMLGLGGLRTYEKYKDVARSSLVE